MKVTTFIGAAIAAFIGFMTAIIALFIENPDLTVGQISQATWIVVGGGAIVAFAKDAQTVWLRKKMGDKE